KIILSIIIFLIGSLSLQAQTDWTTLTSFKDIHKLMVINDSLYVATMGGLLIIDDYNSPGRIFLNSDGLGTTQITDIIRDDQGQVWLSGYGRLIKFNYDNPEQFLFLPAEGDMFLLTRLADDGSNLWVGTDSGLVLFSKINDGGQIEGHFPLTSINSFPEINDILIVGDSIWVATSSGLVAADKSNPSALYPPSAWFLYNNENYSELTSNTINAIANFEDKIFIATDSGLYRFDQSISDTNFVLITPTQYRRVFDLEVINDSLYVFYDGNGLGVLKNDLFTTMPTAGLTSSPATGIEWANKKWVGIYNGGLFSQSPGESFDEYEYTGLPNNDVTTITLDGQRRIVAGFGLKIFARYENGIWFNTGVAAKDGTMSLMTDRNGDVWAGTWGQGLWQIKDDTVIVYGDTNSTVVGIPENNNYVVPRGIATDGERIFVTAYRAYNNSPVAVGQLDYLDIFETWDAIGENEGLNNVFVTDIGYGNNQLAVGTEGVGVYLCDVVELSDGTVRADCEQYTRENSPLISNIVTVIEYSIYGNAFVGTNFGLSRWDDGIERFVDVNLPAGIGPNITALAFDDRNNLWIGTKTGLARRDAVTFEMETFTTENSNLVSNEIADLYLDKSTGDLYVATGGGISILKSEIQNWTATTKKILAVPNPFVIKSETDKLNFNYTKPATVNIYTVAGEAVDNFSVNIPWNGKNKKGKEVASGVYLFVITSEEGEIASGKFLLVRE
ncbi:MAG: two-component regulator propeller domain-containing protein, partial [bacterium]